MHVQLAVLGATRQGRDDLERIEQAVGIERALHGREGIGLIARELHAHPVDFLDADAMLAGDRAADLDAQLENRRTESLGALGDAGLVGVEQDQRVQIAVAGVENIETAQAELPSIGVMAASTRPR
jgi:hypothetical protein